MKTLNGVLAIVSFAVGFWSQMRLNARKQHFKQTMRVYNQLLRAGQEADLPHVRVNYAPSARRLLDPYEKWQDDVSTAELHERDLVVESTNAFYNAYVATYFQQKKRLEWAVLGSIALFGFIVWSNQE